MTFFANIFKPKTTEVQPKIQMGRYEPIYFDSPHQDLWNQATSAFAARQYLKAYTHLLDYLKNKDNDNVAYVTKKGILKFRILQGSTTVYGYCDYRKMIVSAPIVQLTSSSSEFLQSLLRSNYYFQFCKYSIDDKDQVTLVFDTFVEDGSPQKVLAALTELALEADKKDDIWLSQYEGLSKVKRNDMQVVNERIGKIMTQFVQSSYQNAINELKSNPYYHDYPGAVSYILLGLLYKLDFLVKPEGKMMEVINEAQSLFFDSTADTVESKNSKIMNLIEYLASMTYADFKVELYHTTVTFSPNQARSHRRWTDIIIAQNNDLKWYENQGRDAIVIAICDYIVGFSLYNYTLSDPLKPLLKLYYEVMETEYFAALGYDYKYILKGELNKSNILKALTQIIKKFKTNHPNLDLNSKLLRFDSKAQFAKSYLMMLEQMDGIE